MLRFLVTRAMGLMFVLLCITFITFIMGYFAPGDPVRVMMGLRFDPVLYANLKHEYGLDLPWWRQYINFVLNLLHGTFGLSYHYVGRPAWDVLKEGLPFSIELGLGSFLVTLIIGIPSGIIAALRANTHVDTAVSTTMLLLYSIPDIVFIIFFQVFMVWLYDRGLPYLPVAGWDTWQARIAPILITGTTGVGYFARLTKTTVLQVLNEDYVRTARAKGLFERVVIYRHALRNAAIPLITVIGPSLAFLVTGVFITEQFFNIPGVSSITLDAIAQRDYPIIQATVVLTAAAVVFFNALTDLTYALVDPRIRIE